MPRKSQLPKLTFGAAAFGSSKSPALQTMQNNYRPENSSANQPNVNRYKRRNIFPVVAILAAAGATVGILGLILNLADTVGGAPTPIEAVADNTINGRAQEDRPTLTLMPGGNTLSASIAAPASLPLSTVIGAHAAPVVSILAPSAERLDTANTPSADLPIITSSKDNTVRVWASGSSAKTQRARTLTHNSFVNDIALVPSPRDGVPVRLVSGSGSGEIKLWDFDANKLITTIADNSGRILGVAASADGRYVASGSSNGSIKIWPVETIAAQKSQTNLRGQALKTLGPAVSALAFHPTNPNLLISGDAEGTLHLWDIAREQISLTFASSPASSADNVADARISSLAFSPDGRYVASAAGGSIHIWDIQTGRLAQMLSGQGSQVSDLAFSPDGAVLASSNHNQTVKTWDWAEATVFCTLDDEAGEIHSVAFAEGGDALISGNEDGTVRAWDLGKDSNRACLGR